MFIASESQKRGRHRPQATVIRSVGPVAIFVMSAAVVCGGLGAATATLSPGLLFAGAFGLLAASLFLSQRAVLLAVLPLAFAAWRVPVVPQGVSAADVVLLVGVCIVLVRGARIPPRASLILRGVAAYQAILLVAVAYHPTPAAVVDWGHRFFLMAGGLLVGIELARMGSRSVALRIFAYACAVVASVAMIQAILTNFEPVYPLGLSKNLAGEILAGGSLVAICLGRQIFTNGAERAVMPIVVLGGLAATQSRGAWIGLAVALILWAFYVRPSGKVIVAMVVLGVAGAVYIATSLEAESQLENSQQTSSLESRQFFEDVARGDFAESPWVGQGIRYYLDPESGFPAPLSEDGSARPSPHNVVLETLSESGVVGMLAFVVLLGHTAVCLLRRRTAFSVLALVSLAGNLTHGLVDIYWLAGSLTVPWVLCGLASLEGGSRRGVGPSAPSSNLAHSRRS